MKAATGCLTEHAAWLARLALNGERRLLVISGRADWCERQAGAWFGPDGLWLGPGPDACAPQPLGHISRLLGREYRVLVYNAHGGFHPQAFGALLGTARAGGLVLLLCPPLALWPARGDPDLARHVALPEQAEGLYSLFLQRLVRLLQEDPEVLFHCEGGPAPAPRLPPPRPWRCRPDRHGCLNPGQRHALAVLLAATRRRRPVLLTADRGRGKSALLGRLAARLARRGLSLALTAPSPATAARALEHAAGGLGFIAPDALLATTPPLDVLLVDEAAAIPVPMLLALAQRYCCVFATTEHGYEGTGLGFQLKFRPALARLAPERRQARLEEPARWSRHDPLEPLVFRLLALDADPPSPPPAGRLRFTLPEPAGLAGDETLLRQVFGLLALAHYQTNPDDLRRLLDAPGHRLLLAWRGPVPVAAAWLVREGELAPALGREIRQGRRRPRGHLLPQSLAFHGGLEAACGFSYQRVTRIVVHPGVQRQGLGGQLLAEVVRRADTDFVGASFGASPELLAFWQQQGFRAVRLGLTADGVSGLHAAMVLRPLSERARAVLPGWRAQFAADLAFFARGPLAGWLRRHPGLRLLPPLADPHRDARLAAEFAHGHRDLAADRPLLARLAGHRLGQARLSIAERALLTDLLAPGADTVTLARAHGLAGQKAAIRALRRLVGLLLAAPQ